MGRFALVLYLVVRCRRQSRAAAVRPLRSTDARRTVRHAGTLHWQQLIRGVERGAEAMNRSQLGFGPFAQLGEIAMGCETAHRFEHWLSGGEVGERQAQTE